MGAEGQKEYIPVYMRCKEYTNDDFLEDFIETHVKPECENGMAFESLKASSRFLETSDMVLLFDGLDEIEDEQAYNKFALDLKNFKKTKPFCNIIVSSRPIKLEKKDFLKFRYLDLLHLEPKMINEYIDKWFPTTQRRLKSSKKLLKTNRVFVH